MNTFFNARDLWAVQGCPYIEPDIVQPAYIPPVIRTMLFAGFWQARSTLAFDADVFFDAFLQGQSTLAFDAEVVEA